MTDQIQQRQSMDNEKTLKLRQLVEKGEGEAVLLYATSANVLASIINNGIVSPYPRGNVTYMNEIWERRNLMYFFLPLVEKMMTLKEGMAKTLGRDLIKKVKSETTRFDNYVGDEVPWPIDNGKLLAYSDGYARDQAISHYFEQMTNLKADAMTIFFLLNKYATQEFEAYSDEHPASLLADTDEHKLNYRTFKHEVDAIESQYEGRIEELAEILKRSIKLKGVIIYYKQDVLNREEVILGPEDEKDVIIATDSPLTLDDIEGVEFLSEEDANIAFNLINQ